jgi:predicted CXXCH cytochrome family protein
MKRNFLILAVAVLCLCVASVAQAQSVVGSRHDMSPRVTEPVGAGAAVCVYCHTPHGGNNAQGPLWNRIATTATYTPYSSSTIDMTIATASQVGTNLCMSCHDGSIALNVLVNAPTSQAGVYGSVLSSQNYDVTGFTFGTLTNALDTELGAFGTDLSSQHPVGVTYDNTADTDFNGLPTTNALPFFGGSSDQLECSTCHDVHEYTNVPFLRVTNAASALCLECHIK